MLEGTPWTPGTEGTINVRKDKERPGGIRVPKGDLCARIRGTPAAGMLVLEVLPPGDPDEEIDQRIIAAVDKRPGIKAGEIRDAVKGDGRQVSKRLLRLIKSGDIIRQKGDGKATHHYLEDPTPDLSDASD